MMVFCELTKWLPRASPAATGSVPFPPLLRSGDAAGKPSLSPTRCSGLPFTQPGESSHPTASLQGSAGLIQVLSKGLIC